MDNIKKKKNFPILSIYLVWIGPSDVSVCSIPTLWLSLITLTVTIPRCPALTNTSTWLIQYFHELTVEHCYHLCYLVFDLLFKTHAFWRTSFICTVVCICLIIFFIKCIFSLYHFFGSICKVYCAIYITLLETKTKERFGLDDLKLESSLSLT